MPLKNCVYCCKITLSTDQLDRRGAEENYRGEQTLHRGLHNMYAPSLVFKAGTFCLGREFHSLAGGPILWRCFSWSLAHTTFGCVGSCVLDVRAGGRGRHQLKEVQNTSEIYSMSIRNLMSVQNKILGQPISPHNLKCGYDDLQLKV